MFGFFKRKKNHDKGVEEKDKSVLQEEQGEQQESADSASSTGEKPATPDAAHHEQAADVALDANDVTAEEETPSPAPALNATEPEQDAPPAEVAQSTQAPQLKDEAQDTVETSAPAKASTDESLASADATSTSTGDVSEQVPSGKGIEPQPDASAPYDQPLTASSSSAEDGAGNSGETDPLTSAPEKSDSDKSEKEDKASRGGWFSRMRGF